jgi:polyhydroxyalkanoate synthase
MGGTMAAAFAATNPRHLDRLMLAVAPVDFHADAHDADPAHGLLNLWVRSLEPEDLSELVAIDGNLSGLVTGMIFSQLNPVRTLQKYAIEMLETAPDRAQLATFMAMEKWLADRPDLPGALARSWLIDLYRNNDLAEGRLTPGGQMVDLAAISVPVLNIFATGDHIVPPPCSRALGRFVAPHRYTELALPTGHVGAFISAKSQSRLAPAMVAWLRRTDHSGAI